MNIRRCELNDADNMLKMLLALDKETDYMMFGADERPKDINRVKDMINQSINGDDLLLIAVEDENIIGFLSAQRGIPAAVSRRNNCISRLCHNSCCPRGPV